MTALESRHNGGQDGESGPWGTGLLDIQELTDVLLLFLSTASWPGPTDRAECHVQYTTPVGSSFKLLVPGRGRKHYPGCLRIHELHSEPKEGINMA